MSLFSDRPHPPLPHRADACDWCALCQVCMQYHAELNRMHASIILLESVMIGACKFWPRARGSHTSPGFRGLPGQGHVIYDYITWCLSGCFMCKIYIARAFLLFILIVAWWRHASCVVAHSGPAPIHLHLYNTADNEFRNLSPPASTTCSTHATM